MNAIIIFIQKAIGQGIGILFGANGEILTEIRQSEPWRAGHDVHGRHRGAFRRVSV